MPASIIDPGVLFGAMAVSFLAGLMLGWFGFRPRRLVDHLAEFVALVKQKHPRSRIVITVDPSGDCFVKPEPEERDSEGP